MYDATRDRQTIWVGRYPYLPEDADVARLDAGNIAEIRGYEPEIEEEGHCPNSFRFSHRFYRNIA